MRLFIAIELSGAAREFVRRRARDLAEAAESGRFTAPDNFHITLHFLGESRDLVGAVSAMRRAAVGIRPFTLRIGDYAAFEHSGRKTAILTVDGDLGEANILHQSLSAALEDAGFSLDRRRYTPHVTLGRSVAGDGAMPRGETGPEFTVRSITLFESARGRNGALEYRPLHTERF